MKGIHLRSLSGELYPVKKKYEKNPVLAIQGVPEKLGHWYEELRENWSDFSFIDQYHRLSLEMLRNFSFDELCKLDYSSTIMMDESVRKLFETDVRYEVVRKIRSSMWRWGMGRGTWGGMVDTYNNIRNFTFLDDPDFDIRLDYTTYHNECGYSKFSRTYLDGVFAFLIYFKKKHVLTIGFSITEKRQVLIQQIQSKNRKGNRYLYRLPENRVEFVIELFQRNFPGYTIQLIDGEALVDKTLLVYARARMQREHACFEYRKELERSSDAPEYLKQWLRNGEAEIIVLAEKMAQLREDRDRLIAFYRNLGRFRLGKKPWISNQMPHFLVRGT